MRAHLTAALLFSVLLAACSTSGNIPPSKNIDQEGPLRVHPGLLGKPVPPELQADLPARTTKADAPASSAAAPQAAAQPAAQPANNRDLADGRGQRSVYFDLNSADIKPEYASLLAAHARHLAANPQARVRIEGNADERGEEGYNRRLGLKRAESVREAMIRDGAKPTQIDIKSLGKSNPKLAGHDEASWAENRRADIVYEKGQ